MPVKKKKVARKITEEESAFSLPSPETIAAPEVAIRKTPFNKTALLIAGAILTLIVIVFICLYYYLQYQKNQQMLKNPLLASEKEQETLVADVGKLTQLPSELPTIAKVSDITKLQGQPFFQKAKDGDYVLIYPKAQEAILYDPAGNKIVQITTITANQSVQGASTTVVQPTSAVVSVAIDNGTTIPGLAKKVTQDLQQHMTNVAVVSNGNAAKQDYTQTVVIDLTGRQAAIAAQLAKQLKGTVESLPNGEVKPTGTEILVILGKQ